jgi:hypothetical protein
VAADEEGRAALLPEEEEDEEGLFRGWLEEENRLPELEPLPALLPDERPSPELVLLTCPGLLLLEVRRFRDSWKHQ